MLLEVEIMRHWLRRPSFIRRVTEVYGPRGLYCAVPHDMPAADYPLGTTGPREAASAIHWALWHAPELLSPFGGINDYGYREVISRRGW